ncbi:MAG: hypothetical protein R2784_12745 [Saprospiraceae bacterium]
MLKRLSEPRDSLAEKAINEMVQQSPPIVPKVCHRMISLLIGKKIWMESAYLSSNYELPNYRLRCRHQQNFKNTAFIFRPDEVPEYRVYFKENYCLQFTLNKATFKSVYLPLEPYKEMDGLRDFNYAVFSNGKIIRANSHDCDLGLEAEELPKVGSWERLKRKIMMRSFSERCRHLCNDRRAFIGSISMISILHFSFAFSYPDYLFKNKRVVFREIRRIWRKMPIQSRIQITIFAMVLPYFSLFQLELYCF